MPNFVSKFIYYGCSLIRDIGALSVRQKYYHEQHKKRWETRYLVPYPEADGEFGTTIDTRWLNA